MKIGEVAKQAGVGIETIRFYERKGLLGKPPRTPSGYRAYPSEAVVKIRFIKRSKELGFSLLEIAALLSLATSPTANCADVKHRALAKVSAIQERMTDLQRMKRVLMRLVDSCNGRGPVDHCPIIECFGTLQPKGGITMNTTRHVEIFSAGCQACEDTITLVKQLACPSCEVTVLDMKDHIVAQRAGSLGIRTVPAVVVDDRLAECCAESGPSEQILRTAGIGSNLS